MQRGAMLAAALGAVPLLGFALALGLLVPAAITLAHLRHVALRPLPPAGARSPVTRTLVNLFISRAFVFLGFYTMLDYLYFFVASVLPRALLARRNARKRPLHPHFYRRQRARGRACSASRPIAPMSVLS